jgi:hypothetical protein
MLLSCVPSKINIVEYATLDIDSKIASHRLPDYIIKKKRPKIAILPPSDATQYKQCQLYNVAWEYLTQYLQIAGMELVERSQLNAIMQELKFREGISGDIDIQKFTQIARGVDFVVVGSVTSALTRADFSEGRTWTDKKGKVHYTPPSCSEEGKVSLSIRLLNFPSGIVQKTFLMEGKEFLGSREVSSSYECQITDPCGVLALATKRAIDNSKEDLIRAFPVYGYIYKTLTHPKEKTKRIAFINLGINDGLQPNSKLDIVEFLEERDPISGVTLLRTQTIGECTVSETDLQADKAICVISEDSVDRVLVGHAVKLKGEEGVIRTLQKWIYK